MASINCLEIGRRIKEQRKLNGYSREKLADLAGITPRYCYDLELGNKNMSVKTLCKLSDSLHVPTDYILFGTQSRPDSLDSITGVIKMCPSDKLEHLEQIISHYVQAVKST